MTVACRRDFLKALGASVAAMVLPRGLAAAESAAPGAPRRPNLLVLHTDEHNFRTLGCYRALLAPEHAFVWGPGVAVETPNIDWIARNGAIADRFYASSPVCTPSRAAFVSGRFPQNTGAPVNDVPMRDDVVTFAEALRRSGYATGYAGKWHVDGPAKPGWAPARKFGFDDNRYMFNRGHWKQLEDTPSGPRVKAMDAKGQPTYNVQGADERSFTTDFLASKTIEFIRAHKDRPFCYMVSFPDPHGPNTVRPPYDTMFDHLKFQMPASGRSAGEGLPAWARPPAGAAMENMSKYFGMVKCIDDNAGRILAALRESGLVDRTIIVFTSDHGDMCGEHGRVNKGVPMEASARIPLLVYYPGRIKPGTVVREAIANADFKPTILGLMGVPGDGRDEGRDASAIFLGARPPGWKDVAFSRHAGGQWLMAVSSRYKLVLSADGEPGLFDLDRDPLEMRNLFHLPESREIIRDLARSLADHSRRFNEPNAEQPGIREDLAWAAEGTGPYVPSNREGARGEAAGKRAARKGAKGKARAADDADDSK